MLFEMLIKWWLSIDGDVDRVLIKILERVDGLYLLIFDYGCF